MNTSLSDGTPYVGRTYSFLNVFFSHPAEAWIMTALAMIGRFCISVGFFLVYLFTAELFPTMLRASSIGFCSMLGRVGAIASAYIGELVCICEISFLTCACDSAICLVNITRMLSIKYATCVI